MLPGGRPGRPHYVRRTELVQVTSIISDNSNVSGMTLATGDNLIVSGRSADYGAGSHFLQQTGGQPGCSGRGDKVVTSDISDKYLPNILISYISTINKDTPTI